MKSKSKKKKENQILLELSETYLNISVYQRKWMRKFCQKILMHNLSSSRIEKNFKNVKDVVSEIRCVA